MSAPHEHQKPAPEISAEDSGSRALAEALGSSFFFVKIIMAVLVVVFLASGAVTVGPQERAVILHFGKPGSEGAAGLLGPGLHFAFPAPIDEVVKIPIGQIQYVTSTIGWYATPEQAGKLSRLGTFKTGRLAWCFLQPPFGGVISTRQSWGRLHFSSRSWAPRTRARPSAPSSACWSTTAA